MIEKIMWAQKTPLNKTFSPARLVLDLIAALPSVWPARAVDPGQPLTFWDDAFILQGTSDTRKGSIYWKGMVATE